MEENRWVNTKLFFFSRTDTFCVCVLWTSVVMTGCVARIQKRCICWAFCPLDHSGEISRMDIAKKICSGINSIPWGGTGPNQSRNKISAWLVACKPGVGITRMPPVCTETNTSSGSAPPGLSRRPELTTCQVLGGHSPPPHRALSFSSHLAVNECFGHGPPLLPCSPFPQWSLLWPG